MEKECLECGTLFETRVSSTSDEYQRRKFCSYSCRSVQPKTWLRGRKHTASHNKKISEGLKRAIAEGRRDPPSCAGMKVHSEEWKRALSRRLTKDNPARRPEVKKKISRARKGMKLPKQWCEAISQGVSKENNPNWKGGVTKEHQKERSEASRKLHVWRNKVYRRDGYTCQKCGESPSNRLNAHHIKPWAEYPEHRFDVDNGLTLCVDCHKEVHYA